MLEAFSLKGKTGLVTGGGRGIGKAIALTFAEAGADVAVAARTKSEIDEVAAELQALGRRAIAIQADISDSQQVDEMVARATDYLGRIDILVNNAGTGRGGTIAPIPDPVAEWPDADHKGGTTDEDWDVTMRVNLDSAFYCSRAVGAQMIERRYGKVINISSTNAIIAYPGVGAYSASKIGMNMLTKILAGEWARYNICVNCIGPGWFMTEMSREGFEDPEISKVRMSQIPMGRLTDVKDLGYMAVYLASPAADWLTGQIIYLDGGESAKVI
jgi:NAD(P)-dependent dehydrogenase (short-subunit alcohol dehydrogenase family)